MPHVTAPVLQWGNPFHCLDRMARGEKWSNKDWKLMQSTISKRVKLQRKTRVVVVVVFNENPFRDSIVLCFIWRNDTSFAQTIFQPPSLDPIYGLWELRKIRSQKLRHVLDRKHILHRLRRLEIRRLRRPQWTYKGMRLPFCLLPFRWKETPEILYYRISFSTHSPEYSGALFSLNARRPSSLSLVGMTCRPKNKQIKDFVSKEIALRCRVSGDVKDISFVSDELIRIICLDEGRTIEFSALQSSHGRTAIWPLPTPLTNVSRLMSSQQFIIRLSNEKWSHR